MGLKMIDVERVRKPSPHLQLFEPTQEKFDYICDKLLHTPLYLSDEYRNEQYIMQLVAGWFGASGFHLCYEINVMDGIVALQNIYPTWKARVTIKLWNKNAWKPSLVKELIELRDFICDQFELVKLETGTADPIVVKLAKCLGFWIEGVQQKGYKWENIHHDYTLLGWTPGGKCISP